MASPQGTPAVAAALTAEVVATPFGVAMPSLGLEAAWPTPWHHAVHPPDLAVLAAEQMLRAWGLRPVDYWDVHPERATPRYTNRVVRIV